jgi:uncharacterized protein YbjQ (UPF0145 family)
MTAALTFPERPVERHLDMVFGVIVRSMGMAKGITAGCTAMAGGEVTQYTRLAQGSRRHARTR